MNVNDSEVVLSVLADHGYQQTGVLEDADVVLVNTCAIRDNAEQKIWTRLGQFKAMKLARRKADREQPALVVGVLGCMAERLKIKLLESNRLVDIVAGPDAYRDMPRLIEAVQGTSRPSGRGGAMNVQLSLEETYADIVPLRPAGAVATFLSIMRGCNNMCAFCIVPFTRGRERSRPVGSILAEVRMLSDNGVKEVTLLGQNVNSYADFSSSAAACATPDPSAVYAQGFTSVYKPKREGAVQFAELLDAVADIDPEMRIRFTSPHPKDFSDEVLQVIASRHNVCKQLHMPAQSGSSSMLERMRRGYSREAYDALVAHVREVITQVALSTDIIAGFCGETDEEHQATVDLLSTVGFEQAFLFAYSEREKTQAARHLQDDVPPEVKSARLQELIAVYRQTLHEINQQEVGCRHLVLVEGPSRKSATALTGKTCTMKRVIFDDCLVPASYMQQQQQQHTQSLSRTSSAQSDGWSHPAGPLVGLRPGDYVAVELQRASTGTLFATPLARTTLQEFVQFHGTAVPKAVHPPIVPDMQLDHRHNYAQPLQMAVC
ncbi:hypothetical protein WJX72_001730 [[Myrmecia] bisecta]|uniref:Uncharacterized protein n=1 Tax=[Myrmecia] bisecta TaxID=41462 RepID=A0AAW1QPC3_9CHLO